MPILTPALSRRLDTNLSVLTAERTCAVEEVEAAVADVAAMAVAVVADDALADVDWRAWDAVSLPRVKEDSV